MGVRFPPVALERQSLYYGCILCMKIYWKNQKLRRIFLFRFCGNFLILSSALLIGKTFSAPVVSEVRYFADTSLFQKRYYVIDKTPQKNTGELIPIPKNDTVPKSQLASLFNIQQLEPLVPVDSDFSIVIPKIAANARVLSNVDVTNENEYLEKLKLGVAHAAGTHLPGQNGHIFLFAHSTDYVWNVGTYNAVFYLLYKLEEGDEIDIFYQGRRHVYEVTGKKVVNPTDVEYLTRQTPTETLTLQTCWPPGTTLQRILVFARPKVQKIPVISGVQ